MKEEIITESCIRWPIGFNSAIQPNSRLLFGSNGQDNIRLFDYSLKMLTGLDTVVQTGLTADDYCQSSSHMDGCHELLDTICRGNILLKADFTPIILATQVKSTHLTGFHGYTVMHAYMSGGIKT